MVENKNKWMSFKKLADYDYMILRNLHDLYDRACSDVEKNIKAYRKKEDFDS